MYTCTLNHVLQAARYTPHDWHSKTAHPSISVEIVKPQGTACRMMRLLQGSTCGSLRTGIPRHTGSWSRSHTWREHLQVHSSIRCISSISEASCMLMCSAHCNIHQIYKGCYFSFRTLTACNIGEQPGGGARSNIARTAMRSAYSADAWSHLAIYITNTIENITLASYTLTNALHGLTVGAVCGTLLPLLSTSRAGHAEAFLTATAALATVALVGARSAGRHPGSVWAGDGAVKYCLLGTE